MGDHKEDKKQQKPSNTKKRDIGSTTSLGKRRSLKNKRLKSASPAAQASMDSNEHPGQQSPKPSTMSDPKTSEYGSQATLLRVADKKPADQLTKVAVLGAAGGIGQPLSLLLMVHSEYIQHLALYDVAHVRGVGADLSHIDRHCKVTTHLGPNELADAVKGASVIVILAGIAQKPGMTRDDLFGTNAKIIFDLARTCAKHAPDAHLAIVSNPVNSLLPLVYTVYKRILGTKRPHETIEKITVSEKSAKSIKSLAANVAYQSVASPKPSELQDKQQAAPNQQSDELPDWARRLYGVTTLDVVRASTLTAQSEFFPALPSGLFKDPAKVSVPVVGGHAGKTIIPLLSRATPRLDRKSLEDASITGHLIHSIQEAGIDVLNAKQGAGSATLAMAYAACRFTVSLLRAQQGEANIVECAFVKHKQPIVGDLDYFALPLQLGKNGYVKAHNPLAKLMPFEDKMIEEGAKLLRASVVKGEDSAREQLSNEKS